VQLIHQTTLSSEDYIYNKEWQKASLDYCPHSNQSTCRVHRHGSYARNNPKDLRIARFYCPTCQMTFSMLPSFMSARTPGTLQDLEDAALAMEECDTLSAAQERIRPGYACSKDGQRRWFDRRVRWVQLALVMACSLFPDTYANTPMRLGAFRAQGATTTFLMTLRESAPNRLQSMSHPVGLKPCGCPIESQTSPPTQADS